MTSTLFKSYLEIDEALGKEGVFRTSDVWLREIERFYADDGVKLFVGCIGRGGAKSTTSCKMAITEVVAGYESGIIEVPPGEVHLFAHVSESVPEANKTMNILGKYLGMLGIKNTATEKFKTGDAKEKGTILLGDMPLGFRVMACRIGAVSGFRCVGWTADEVAKWSNDGSDPSDEIISSVKAMTITHQRARGRMISSPLGTVGYFYEAFKIGDSSDQVVCQHPTWVANPSVTEEQTHKLERNEDKWRREYAAIPIEGNAQSLFSAEMLRRALRPKEDKPAHVERMTPIADAFAKTHPWAVPPEPGVTYTAAMDPALLRNTWTMVIAGKRRCKDGRVRRSIVYAQEWTATRDHPLDPFKVLGEIAAVLREYDLLEIRSDQHHSTSLQAIANRPEIDIYVRIDPSTSVSNLAGYEQLFTMLSDQDVELPDYQDLRGDLLGVRRVVTQHGLTVRLDEVGNRHSDYAPSAMKALNKALVDPEAQGPKAGSPEALRLEEIRYENDLIAKLERSKSENSSGDYWKQDGRAAGFDL